MKDAVVVVRGAGGRVELRQSDQTSLGDGAVAGGTVGLLAGLLLGVPIAGAVAGVVAGASWGARDTGIDDGLLRRLGDSLLGGAALVVVLVEPGTREETQSRLTDHAGTAVAVP